MNDDNALKSVETGNWFHTLILYCFMPFVQCRYLYCLCYVIYCFSIFM